MVPKIQAPKGTQDLLPADAWKWQAIEQIARDTAALYGYREIRTPIFEHSELFHRGVGETSDIVTKETFTFDDRGGRSVTLRPEGTAGVVRAMIENSLLADQGARAKVYYIAPNFRYERPEKGRFRQHHQFGAEAFGIAEPEQDVECILLQMDFYRRCGVKELELKINSLGDRESKARFAEAIVAQLSPHKSELSEESQRRLSTNPLRILDSKDVRDRNLTSKLFVQRYLSDKSDSHLDRVKKLLDDSQLLKEMGVAAYVDGQLVRGFDYYTETLWEVTAGGLGSQNAIGGGGRYDNLVEQLGGRPTPGVGFGSGLERLLIALEAQSATLPNPRKPLVWMVVQGDAAKTAAWPLLAELRAAGIASDIDLSGRGIKGQFKLADRESAAWCIILGDSEVQAGTVALKNMQSGEQTTVDRGNIVSRLQTTR